MSLPLVQFSPHAATGGGSGGGVATDLGRLEELLAERVTGGDEALSARERAELERLCDRWPEEADTLEAELVEALLSLPPIKLSKPPTASAGRYAAAMAGAGAAVALPSSLRAAIARDASLVLDSAAGGTAAVAEAAATSVSTTTSATSTAGSVAAGSAVIGGLSLRVLTLVGWLAAAGIGATAGVAWFVSESAAPEASALLSEEQLRFSGTEMPLSLSYHVVKDRDALRVALHPRSTTSSARRTADAEAGRGVAIWSDRRQAGLVQIQDLPANDPAQQQYQLWVIDLDRPADANRVNAGLFSITGDQAVQTVEARPNLPVGHAGGFIVTLEPAGGSLASFDDTRVILTGSSGR